MADKQLRSMIKDVLYEVAEGIERGSFAQKMRVGITLLGSELGAEEILCGAELAQRKNPQIQVVCIGQAMDTELEIALVEDEQEQHGLMEQLLDSGDLDACVTMHYSFPIGVATVGKVIAPGNGKELILATTTGTSATDRIEAMVRNAISGIATAKATGIMNPTVGILNIEGARAVERALNKLRQGGYEFSWSTSGRSDGGAVMRGNDLLSASADVMVTDSLTGNVLMKMFSSFTTGGNYESLGYGYGPGVSGDYHRIVGILSRASGAPVVANAISYAAQAAFGKLTHVAQKEFEAAKKAGLHEVCEVRTTQPVSTGDVAVPPAKSVTEEITGIEILDLEDAAKAVWKAGIYAETGMGCVGPVVMVAPEDKEKAQLVLVKAGYLD